MVAIKNQPDFVKDETKEKFNRDINELPYMLVTTQLLGSPPFIFSFLRMEVSAGCMVSLEKIPFLSTVAA